MFLESHILVLDLIAFTFWLTKLVTSNVAFQETLSVVYVRIFSLGMHHDGSGNSCAKDGYIMSPSRGVNGETQWSSCSADVMNKLR